MHEYSRFISNAMRYVDEEIPKINPSSINIQRLRYYTNKAFVIEVKRLYDLEPDRQMKEIADIWGHQLLIELSKMMWSEIS